MTVFIDFMINVLFAVCLFLMLYATSDIEIWLNKFICEMMAQRYNWTVKSDNPEDYYTYQNFYSKKIDRLYIVCITVSYVFGMLMYFPILHKMGFYTVLKELFMNAYCFFIVFFSFILIYKNIKKGILAIKAFFSKFSKNEK